ncbi:MAG: methyltransferase-like protein [Candidatus Peregrinibacteria bacterium GW2011_GWC2_33_13]|nr:MAG: methyltransferase-like protein [Candidatus Peregrinibacteria bacterium GW2011_GWC2_33_13]
MSPVSNAYIKPENLQSKENFYPLHAYVCEKCFLVQLEEFESPEQIFNDEYAYFSSFSDSWLKHCKNYTDIISKKLNLSQNSKVVEIASNDGYLLQYFVEKNIPVLGVEPSSSVAKIAEEKGIKTVTKFFGVNTANELANIQEKADLIIGNNVLAHVPDINDFVGGIKILLKESGTVTIEFPHLLNLINKNQFDTIYHEHFSYLSLYTVEKIFNHHGMDIYDVEELPTHGGSLRIYACHLENMQKSKNVINLLSREKEFGLTDLITYTNFSEKVKETKRKLLKHLIELKKTGKSIVGYGAAAKGNTLLNYCGIGNDFIDYVVDKSPYKQGLFLPGTHISIESPEKITQTKPDYIFILPWNIKDEIINQLSYVKEWGCKFIVPIPEVYEIGTEEIMVSGLLQEAHKIKNSVS